MWPWTNPPTLPMVNINFWWPLTLLLINVVMFINLTCPIYHMGIQQSCYITPMEESCYITPVTCNKSLLICSVKNQIPCSVCHLLSHERVSLGLHLIQCHLSIKTILTSAVVTVICPKKKMQNRNCLAITQWLNTTVVLLFHYNNQYWIQQYCYISTTIVNEYNNTVTFPQQQWMNTTALLHFHYNIYTENSCLYCYSVVVY